MNDTVGTAAGVGVAVTVAIEMVFGSSSEEELVTASPTATAAAAASATSAGPTRLRSHRIAFLPHHLLDCSKLYLGGIIRDDDLLGRGVAFEEAHTLQLGHTAFWILAMQ